MKKMLIENIKPILVGMLSLFAVIVGSLSGGYLTSEPSPTSLGATPGSDFTGPTVSFNGLRQWDYSSGLSKASTTICSFRAPAATTTVMAGSIQVTTGSTTPLVFEIAKATVQSATTTRLLYASTTPGYPTFTAQLGVATTTSPEGAITTRVSVSRTAIFSDMIVAPLTYISTKVGGAQGDLNVLVGSCKLRLLEN